MRRVRLLFLVLAAALLLPLLLLVRRALVSVESERHTRHQAVAERVFDEMERALSTVLAREEERPFGHYGFYYAPPGQLAGQLTVARSPLAEPPELPFVVGYFQIDPDGSLHTPLRPREGEPLPGGADWQPSAQALVTIGTIEETVGPVFRAGAGRSRSRAAGATQLPGSTVPVAGGKVTGMEEKDEARSEVSAFDALRSLNKGVEQRAARKSKLSREYAVEQEESGQRLKALGDLAASEPRDFPRQDSFDAARTNEEERYELSPMIGRLTDARHLVLTRTVVHDARAYRQGLLVDVERLCAWLQAQGLGSDGLGRYATLGFSTGLGSVGAEPGPAPFLFQHRFAEPFDDLTARLALAALPGVGGATYVYALSVLLLVTGVLGLAALYRMVSVVVGFAERRSNFVAAVSHELKTPLTAIRMYGEMLRDGIVPSEEKRAEYYGHITAESERLSRLINNVLEFSRLEKQSRRAALVVGQIGPVVEEAAALLRPHAEREGFEVQVDVEPGLPSVAFERDALLQMLFNLVDNAVKYASEGARRRIVVACRRDGSGIRVAVRDQGPGVPAEHLGRIFEPFYRGESELTRRRKGTGLGLALVRGLADCMGARVTGRNAAGGGFEVEIAFAGS